MTVKNIIKYFVYQCIGCGKDRKTILEERGAVGLCPKCKRQQEATKDMQPLFSI